MEMESAAHGVLLAPSLGLYSIAAKFRRRGTVTLPAGEAAAVVVHRSIRSRKIAVLLLPIWISSQSKKR